MTLHVTSSTRGAPRTTGGTVRRAARPVTALSAPEKFHRIRHGGQAAPVRPPAFLRTKGGIPR